MRIWLAGLASQGCRFVKNFAATLALLTLGASSALAQPAQEVGGEASLKLPDLSQVTFLGFDGHRLLLIGILFCIFGLGFGLVIYRRLKNLPVHRAMREISELIYETCKTYLITQGKFLLLLWAFIAVIILLYFGVLLKYEATRVVIILLFSVVGIAGSYGVAWFGIRVNTFANSRTAFAGLAGKPYPIYNIPLQAGMSIGMMLISVELLIMLFILLFVPGDYAGPCFIGFAIGESLGAAALRIAGMAAIPSPSLGEGAEWRETRVRAGCGVTGLDRAGYRRERRGGRVLGVSRAGRVPGPLRRARCRRPGRRRSGSPGAGGGVPGRSGRRWR